MKTPRTHHVSMHRLILMRHAEAAERDADHRTDAARPLTSRGREQAAAVGAWLIAKGLVPSRVVASSAARAQESASTACLAMDLDPRDVESDERLYGADGDTLVALVGEHARADATTMLVGHNPGFAMLRHALQAAPDGSPEGFPPSSVIVLDLPESGDVVGRGELVALRLG